MAQLPNFPSLDMSRLDASKLAGLDDKLVAAVRDAAYITIGFGVLGFQQAQVRRRELVKSVSDRFDAGQLETRKAQLEEMLGTFETQMQQLDGRLDTFEAKLDSTVAKFEARLPEQAAQVVGQMHTAAKTARRQVRGLVRSAA